MAAFYLITAACAALATAYAAAPLWRARPAAAALLAGLAIVAAGGAFALSGGAPEPGAPIARRIAALRLPDVDAAALSPQERVAVLEAIAEDHPDDPMAFYFLAAEYARAGRSFEAVQARERVVALAPSADAYADLGEALVTRNEGQVTPEARRAFAAALAEDPGHPMALWFEGLALEQSGAMREAAALWGRLVAAMPADDPVRFSFAADAVARLSRPQAGPGEDAPAPMLADDADLAAFAETMLARVETRLDEDPDDLPSWFALYRGRLALGDGAGALAALDAADAAADWDEGERALLDVARDLLARAGVVDAG